MFAHTFYSPILRAKTGELDALAYLSEQARHRTFPLLDIPEPTEERRTSAKEQLAWTCEQLAQTWGSGRPLMLDISRYSSSIGTTGAPAELVEHLFKCARQTRLSALPVAGPVWFRGAEYLKAVAAVANRDGRGLACRIPAEDFCEVEQLEDVLESCLAALNLPTFEIDLILDFEAITRLPVSQCSELAITNTALAAIQFLAARGFRRLVLCGSSIPEWPTRTRLPKRLEVERIEFAAWRRITEDRPGLALGFGDYSVISPFQTKPTKQVKVPARVRFATPEKQIFLRDSRSQYRDLSQAAVATEEFRRLPPSWGSTAVRECAANYGDLGGPTQWVARDTNMHIEATVVHVGDHLTRVAPDLLGPPVELQSTPWLQESLSIIGT